MVEAGLLGRKTGKGFYEYREDAVHPKPLEDEELGRKIFRRVFALLVNEAAEAARLQIAAAEEIELAMERGVNYPKGLLAWGDEFGLINVLNELERLQGEYSEERYRPSPLLRQMAKNNERFFHNEDHRRRDAPAR